MKYINYNFKYIPEFSQIKNKKYDPYSIDTRFFEEKNYHMPLKGFQINFKFCPTCKVI